MHYSFLLLPLLLGRVVESINYSPLACNNGVAEVTAPIDSCTPFSKLVNETLSADKVDIYFIQKWHLVDAQSGLVIDPIDHY